MDEVKIAKDVAAVAKILSGSPYPSKRSLSKAREIVEYLENRKTDPWQPIETAPKDGTFILACVKGFTPAVAQWATDFRPEGEFTFLESGMFAKESHWDEMIADSDPWQPTHWMPLPAAPEVE